jgi:predicted small metal-binding protein
MNRLDCPIDGCHASIESETRGDVMERAAAHATQKHPDVELDEQTVADVESKIVSI